MSDRWQEDIRTLKQRKLVFWAVLLSVLVHLAVVVAIFFAPTPPPPAAGDQTVWMDLKQIDPPSTQGEVMTAPSPPGNQVSPPPSVKRLARESNTAEKESHRADIPINDHQADVGAKRPGSSGVRAPRGSAKKYAVPDVGEGMTKRSDAGEGARAAKSAESDSTGPKSVADLVNSVGYEGVAKSGEGGGGGNLSPYNPNVGEAGKAINLNTKNFKYVGYFSGIKEKIEWAWVYPQEAQMMGQQGTLTLTFTILRNGALKDVKRVRGSGFPLLDNAAVQAVRDAAGFGPFPEDWPDEEITIVANFTYHLIGVKSVF
ncbi:MAG: energy transducer TonB [Deltaproteobacteria bacterium]|nr:energy transducer TonB [Deltaproteobacteria bacterium]